MYNIAHINTTAMHATQNRIDVISNNMVNAQTTGYKKLEIGFADLYTETLNKRYYPTIDKSSDFGTGIRTTEAVRRYDQGGLKNTGVNTNIAIEGEGFFRVITISGEIAYTRNGEFKLDALGRIVDDRGNFLDIELNNNLNVQELNLSNGDLTISKVGEVYFNGEQIGKINLYKPQGSTDLISSGDSLFTTKEDGVMEVSNNYKVHQGYLEMSNVRMEQEMTNLILAQRAFQFNAKGIQAADEMWGMINNLQGK